jgi:hypothetical protein
LQWKTAEFALKSQRNFSSFVALVMIEKKKKSCENPVGLKSTIIGSANSEAFLVSDLGN